MTVLERLRPDPGSVAPLLRVWPVAVLALVTGLVVVGLDLPALSTAALWTASWTGLALNALGVNAVVDGTVVASDTFAVNIVAECLALGPMLLFAAAVLVYPRTLRSKAQGLVIGISSIVGVNLLRITSLFLLGSAFPHLLDAVHLLVWQSVMALLALVVWLLWSQGWFAISRTGLLKSVFWASAVLLLLSTAWLGVARDYNEAVAGFASALAGDAARISAVGTHLLIDWPVGPPGDGAPISLSGFTMQWGVLLLASMIAVTSSLSLRSRIGWLLATVVLAFLLHSVGAVALGLVWSAEATSPLISRFALGAFVAFWGVGPIILAGIWCLAFWMPEGLGTFRGLNLFKNRGRAGI